MPRWVGGWDFCSGWVDELVNGWMVGLLMVVWLVSWLVARLVACLLAW